jgi:MYXO-CTERM domain-containing protein
MPSYPSVRWSPVVGSLCLLSIACDASGSRERPAVAHAESALSRPGQLSDERDVERPAYLLDMPGNEINSAVFNGQDFVALRAESPPRLTRISRDGRVLDPRGVSIAPREQYAPFHHGHLASDGTRIALAYLDSGPTKDSVVFRRYDRELAPLGGPLVLAATEGSRRSIGWVGIGHGGGQYLVAWTEYRHAFNEPHQAQIRAVRLSTEGRLLDAAPIEVSTTAWAWEPRIAWDGERFLVVWPAADGEQRITNPRVLGARITAEGQAVDGGVVLASNATSPDLCFSGDHFTLVWNTPPTYSSEGTPSDTFAARVGTDLSVLDEQPLLVAGGPRNQHDPRCTSVGDGALVSWIDEQPDRPDAQVRTLSAAGELGPALPLADTDVHGWPIAMASDGTQGLALWLGGGTRITPEGEPMDGARLAIANKVAAQSAVTIASSGAGALVLFKDERPGTREGNFERGSLRIARVSSEGAPLEAASTVLHEGTSLSAPRLASDGLGYLAVWSEYTAGRTRLLRAAGVGLDGVPAGEPVLLTETPVDGELGSLRVAASRDGYLVTWGYGDVFGRRVASNGAPRGSKFPISAAADHQSEARVAFTGEHYLVLWHDTRGDKDALWMARVSLDGEVLDLLGQRVIEDDFDLYTGFELAADTGGAYAVWGSRAGDRGRHLRGSWIDAGGATHPQGLALPDGLERPSVTADGEGFTLLAEREDVLFATRVEREGQPLGGVLGIASRATSGAFALAPATDGSVLIAYGRPEADDDANRVRVRVLGPRSADVEIDAFEPDAGVELPDAGSDASVEPDAGEEPVEDGGVEPQPDGSVEPQPDAGLVPDAAVPATPDAGLEADASAEPAPDAGSQPPIGEPVDMTTDPAYADEPARDGCSCSVPGSPVGLDRGLWFLGLFGFLSRRRRRPSQARTKI